MRPIMRSESVPTAAAEKRHPHELVGPNSHSPNAIIHLPAGGWTTKSGAPRKTFSLPTVKYWSGLMSVRQASS